MKDEELLRRAQEQAAVRWDADDESQENLEAAADILDRGTPPPGTNLSLVPTAAEILQRAERPWVDDTDPQAAAAEVLGAPPPGTNPKDLIGITKPRLSLVPPASIIYQSLAMGDGAKKYGPYNWRRNKVIASIYIDAALRHIASWQDGEENAADSGVPHLGHALSCLGILVDAIETGNLIDDRPAKGRAAELLAQFTRRNE